MTTPHDAIITAFRRGDLKEALRLAEQQASVGSGSSELHHLLGLIHCRMGRLDTGVDCLKSAVDAEPDNAAYRVMLVRALADSDRAEEALAVATPPPGVSPPELALWHARAESADMSRQHESSAEAWRVLCSARPGDWRAWNNLGEALAALERWSDAADALRRASELNPPEIRIRRNLAAALARAGLYDESANEFEELVKAEPGDSALRLTLARVLADLGRSAESMAQLDQAAAMTVGAAAKDQGGFGYIGIALGRQWFHNESSSAIEPSQVEAVRDLALLFERTNKMDALRELLDDAERAGIGSQELAYPAAALALRDGNPDQARNLLLRDRQTTDVVRWHRLMSKIMDSLGDAGAAFASAEQMNGSVHDFDHWRERGAIYRQRIRALADTIGRSWASALPQLSKAARPSPIFLVGFPRSGTTLLDTLLMGHPDTEVLEEVHMLGAAELVLGRVADLPHQRRSTLEQAREAYFAELDRNVDSPWDRRIIDKLPLNMLGLPVIHSLFSDARIIFAQRHPCDVVLSGFMQSFVMNDAMGCFLTIEDAADFYDAVMEVFMRSREELPLKLHTVVYEELVSDPERSLRPLVDFLDLKWDERILDHQATAQERGAIITPSYDQVIQPLSRKPSGRWRRYAKQLEQVLPILLPWAARLGYSD